MLEGKSIEFIPADSASFHGQNPVLIQRGLMPTISGLFPGRGVI